MSDNETQPRFVRQPEHDRRIGHGDDFAGDAWLDTQENLIVWVAVGCEPGSDRQPNDYERGWADGRTDVSILAQPLNTGEHTFTRYVEIRAKYEDAIFSFSPTGYQRGYGAAFDAVARTLLKRG